MDMKLQLISLCNVRKYELFFSWKFINSGSPVIYEMLQLQDRIACI
jgi:hypothetical protein